MTLEGALGLMIFVAACAGYAAGIITMALFVREPKVRPPRPPHTGWRKK